MCCHCKADMVVAAAAAAGRMGLLPWQELSSLTIAVAMVQKQDIPTALRQGGQRTRAGGHCYFATCSQAAYDGTRASCLTIWLSFRARTEVSATHVTKRCSTQFRIDSAHPSHGCKRFDWSGKDYRDGQAEVLLTKHHTKPVKLHKWRRNLQQSLKSSCNPARAQPGTASFGTLLLHLFAPFGALCWFRGRCCPPC